MQNVIELTKNFVVQRSVLASAKQDALTELMNQIATSGKKMLVVENLNEFFGIPNLINAVNKGDTETLTVVAEKQEIEINAYDLDLIDAFGRFKDNLIAAANAKLPPYTFATVPEGWTVTDNLTVGKQSVSRRKGETGHSIGIKTLERVWKAASLVWNGDQGAIRRVDSISASGYNRDAHIKPAMVEIGCQTIQRYELEQVALHMGWTFPEKLKY